jgi:hypothetical protein
MEADEKQMKTDKMVFLAPLDQLMWDRESVEHLFEFEYRWEVYVPEQKRRWGYYVLPVLYGDRLVGRFDSRYKDGVWQMVKWYWEDGVEVDAEVLEALAVAVGRFREYLGARKLKLPRGMDKRTREVWRRGMRS